MRTAIQVTEQLRLLVATLAAGDRIPGERDLAAEWGVSRMTARKGVEALVAEGLIERRQGAGSYVAEAPYARMPGLSSFSSEMVRRGMTPSSEVLGFERLAATDDVAARLGIAPGDTVLRFGRRRLADGDVVGIEITSIEAALVDGLTPNDLDGSLFDVLESAFGIEPGQADCVIDAVAAADDSAELLGVEPGYPCLRVAMHYLDTRRRPLMLAECVYRPDRYQLHAVVAQHAVSERTRVS